jgi:hypothetical protein
MATDQSTPSRVNRRWFQPTPGKLLGLLLVVELTLLLSNWIHWLPKEWTLLLAVASLGVAMVLFFAWFIFALLFRWRFQFSVRSILIFVTLFAVLCSYFASEFQEAERQQQTARRIVELGGDLKYDYDYEYEQEHQFDDNAHFDPPQPPGSPMLRELLGDDLFDGLSSHSLASIDFRRYAFDMGKGKTIVRVDLTDDNLRELRHLKGLKSIVLWFQPITDAGIVHLQELKSLEHLDLFGTKATDESVKSLAELPNLEHLNVGKTKINPKSLVRLLGTTKLKCLELSDAQIENNGGYDVIQRFFPDASIWRVDSTENGHVTFSNR